MVMFQLDTAVVMPRSVSEALDRAKELTDWEGLLLQGCFGERQHLMRVNKSSTEGTMRFADFNPAFLRQAKSKWIILCKTLSS